jgi:hypothetical protein
MIADFRFQIADLLRDSVRLTRRTTYLTYPTNLTHPTDRTYQSYLTYQSSPRQ